MPSNAKKKGGDKMGENLSRDINFSELSWTRECPDKPGPHTPECDNSSPNCPEWAVLATGQVALRSSLFPDKVAVMAQHELRQLGAAIQEGRISSTGVPA